MQVIEKIFTEPSVFENASFHVVNDKFSICPNHILAFSKKYYKGVNSHDLNETDKLLENVRDNYREDFYFFERGNASFCTSLDGPICSHLHFMPKKHFETTTLSDLLSITKANLLSKGSHLPNTSEEYFFFGDYGNRYFMTLNSKPEKRFLRNYFKSKFYV